MAGALEAVGLVRLAINPKVVALASLALQSIGLFRHGIGHKPDQSMLEPADHAGSPFTKCISMRAARGMPTCGA